jgi:Tol biopolymer transport system component
MVLHTKTDRDGNPNVFNLNANGSELKLNGNNARPDKRWNSDHHFVFLSRKLLIFHIFIL